jgi:hypothetical protein
VLFVVSALWLRPKAAPSPLASSAVSHPGNLRVKTCLPGDSQRSHIVGRNVGFYATYRRREASIYGSTPPGGGGGQRQSSTTNSANPTNGIGILWSPFGRVPSLKCQVSSWRRSGAQLSGLQPHTSQNNALRRHYERGQNAQNEPNFAPPAVAPAANGAKQSQTWGDWCMWAKAVVSVVPGRRVKRAKRTQF